MPDLTNVVRETIAELFEEFGETPPELTDADIEAALELVDRNDEQFGFQMSAGPHSYASTQFDLPPGLVKKIKAIAAEIPKEDLAGDGIETEPHITVKYGLHADDPGKVARLAGMLGPVTVSFGVTSIFGQEEMDVLKIDVFGVELFTLNRLISENLANTETWPTYKPHITVAYVKKGKGRKYAGNDALDGVHVTFDALTFSPSDGEKEQLPFRSAVALSTVDAETTPIDSDNRSRLVSEGEPCPKCKKPVVLGSSGKPECQNEDCDWTACEEQAQPESLMQPGTQAPGTAMSAAEQQWAKDGAFYVELRKELREMIKGDS